MIVLEQPPSLDFSPLLREIPNVITQIPLSWWIGMAVLLLLSGLSPEPVRRRYRRRRW